MKQVHLIRRRVGYTIVEIMVAIMIIGLLAVISVGGYKKYMAKMLIVQAIAAAAPLQQAIQDFYQNQGFLPGHSDLSPFGPPGYSLNGNSWQINAPTTNIASISWNMPFDNCTATTLDCSAPGPSPDRQILITFTNPTSIGTTYLAGTSIMLIANIGDITGVSTTLSVNWLCMAYPNSLTTAADGTTLLSTLLPAGCHYPDLDY